MPDLARRLCAEFTGIFAICLIGILAITHGRAEGGGELLGIALAFGLTVTVMIACFATISGAHFNPAATLAMLLSGRIGWSAALAYLLAQLAGATAAAGLLATGFSTEVVARGCTLPAAGVSAAQALLLEALATGLLFVVVIGTALRPGPLSALAPLAIGLTITLDILAIGPLTGAGLNPARSFGPALISGVWEAQLIYWLGPLLGAAGAALLSRWLFAPDTEAPLSSPAE